MHFPSLEIPCTTFIANLTFFSLCPLLSRPLLTSCKGERRGNGVNGAEAWGLSIAKCENEGCVHGGQVEKVRFKQPGFFRRVTEAASSPKGEDSNEATHLTEVVLKQDTVTFSMHDGSWNSMFQVVAKPQLAYNRLQGNKCHPDYRYWIKTWVTFCQPLHWCYARAALL